jgi:hypothetical protein
MGGGAPSDAGTDDRESRRSGSFSMSSPGMSAQKGAKAEVFALFLDSQTT